ncbi:MAG: hypothetical protein LBP86_04225 [Azoarcus sp.]|jgi:hypothetical protein|nr:hypothetical protein [Azoarcus sp.]
MRAPLSILFAIVAAVALPAAHAETDGGVARAAFSGDLMYFQRHRERYRVDEDRYATNLHHRSVQARVDIDSPFAADTLGVDLGVFASTDLESTGSPDHEINFFPWRDPWSADWSRRHARNGVSLYRAHLKLRHDGGRHGAWWGKFGYFQPSGPGVLGVNWALMPGTWRGAEGGGEINRDWGKLVFAAAWANAYKAPWYRDIYRFRAADGEERVDDVLSLGLRYETGAASVEIAVGEARDYLRNAHLKLKWRRESGPSASTSLSYQLYAASDRVRGHDADYYAGGRAWQHYLAWSAGLAPYALKAEFLHTRAPARAPGHLGYFVYRLSSAYGGANGAYDPWWDNRSDWNHHRESALFLSLGRGLDDLLPIPGFTVTLSTVHARGGRAYSLRETLRESAWSLDLTYLAPSGVLKGGRISLHYTHYDNHTRQPSWEGFKNLFQDEHDFKFLIVLPLRL